MDDEQLENIRNNDPATNGVRLELSEDENIARVEVAQFAEAVEGNTNLGKIRLFVQRPSDEELFNELLLPFFCGSQGKLYDFTLDHNHNELDEPGFPTSHRILDAVATNTRIQNMQLAFATISVEALSNFVQTTTSTRKFGFWNAHFVSDQQLGQRVVEDKLVATFRMKSSIQYLDLSYMQEQYLNPILIGLSESTDSSLRHLEVQPEMIGDEDLNMSFETANALTRLLTTKSLTKFNSLTLESIIFTGAVFGELLGGLQRSASASDVTFNNCRFDAQATRLFKNMCEASTGRLKTLRIGGDMDFSEPIGSILVNFLGSTTCLKELAVTRTNLSAQDSASLGNSLRTASTIAALSLHDCFASIESLVYVFAALGVNETLQLLDIQQSGARTFSPGLLYSLTAGLTRNRTLKMLKMKVCLANEMDDIVGDLALAFRDHGSLTTVDLSGSDISVPALSRLLGGLCNSPQIRRILLRSLLIDGDSIVNDLVSLIESNNSRCRALYLDGTKFSLESYNTILFASQGNKSLEELYLIGDGDEVSDDTKVDFLARLATPESRWKCLRLGNLSENDSTHDDSIMKVYRNNYSLEHCSLKPSNESNRSEVEALFRLNKAGRYYLKDEGKTRAKGVAVLAEVADDLDCLFVHLKENPTLCDIQKSESPARAGRKRRRNQ